MKLSLFDSQNGKFSNVLRFHWVKQGHEVLYTPLWDSRMCVDRDVIFFDWADTSCQRASNPDDQMYKDHGTTMPDTNVIVRCHDIDMWCGNLAGIKPGFVKHLVFVADHIYRQAKEQNDLIPGAKIHIIKHGIDTEKFTFRKPNGQKKIAWVGRYDHNKNPEIALKILEELPRDYTLHILGRRHQASYQVAYWNWIIKRNNLNVVFEEDVPDMNVWLEDKDFLLLTSVKEAFCYAVGEAMAKGIKPIINRFYCAEEIYPEKYLYDKISDAVKMITSEEYNPEEYRGFIEKNYPLDKFFEAYDKLLCE